MYDIIGDVHGHASALKALLSRLDYAPDPQGVWRHPERRLIFVGDLIDRGSEHRELISIVRAMTEAGVARVIMGNHELNAIAYASPDPRKPGDFLRPHTPGRTDQCIKYITEVGEGSALHREHVEWFKTLPLWIEEPGLRVVHACWHAETIERVRPYLKSDASLSEELLSHPTMSGLFDKGTELFKDVELLLKGLEVKLPDGVSFTTGNKSPKRDPKTLVRRRETRVKWWERGHKTWCEAVVMPEVPAELKGLPLTEETRELLYYYDEPTPVFFGHYWMNGTPTVTAPHAICTDWSIGIEDDAKGTLAAYRWTAGAPVCDDHFVYVHKAELSI